MLTDAVNDTKIELDAGAEPSVVDAIALEYGINSALVRRKFRESFGHSVEEYTPENKRLKSANIAAFDLNRKVRAAGLSGTYSPVKSLVR